MIMISSSRPCKLHQSLSLLRSALTLTHMAAFCLRSDYPAPLTLLASDADRPPVSTAFLLALFFFLRLRIFHRDVDLTIVR